jgi:predicted DNA-binding protein
VNLQLSPELEAKLTRLAAQTGRTVAHWIRPERFA